MDQLREDSDKIFSFFSFWVNPETVNLKSKPDNG